MKSLCAGPGLRRPRISLSAALLVLAIAALSSCRRSRREADTIASDNDAGQKKIRIVTLTPSLTEIVFALGRGPGLVGVDDYSDFPPEVQQRPRVGSFLAPNVEAITALAPDVVFLDEVQTDSAKALRSVGVKAIAMQMLTIADVHAGITLVGRELHADAEASALNDKLRRELAAAAELGAATKTAGKRPRALISVDREIGGLDSLVVAGEGSYLHDLVVHAGGDNALRGAKGSYIRVAPESVVDMAPDVILDAVHTRSDADIVQARKDWNLLPMVPAVKNGRVVVFGDRAVVTPGPRLGVVVQQIAKALHQSAQPR